MSNTDHNNEIAEGTPLAVPDDKMRCGFIALVGAPNAGKSTLLNALLGSSVAAVSAKAHTTRRGIVGAFTRGPAQVVLVDTPGLVARAEASRRPRELVCAPWEAMETCDS
jgi:GTP-binding protein Era